MTRIEYSGSVARMMVRFGSAFMQGLGYALGNADEDNRERIFKSFPDYWEKYENMAIDEGLIPGPGVIES